MHNGRSRSSKVIDIYTKRKLSINLLLVINSNFGRILHRFRDIAAQRLKNRFFALPILLWGPRSGGPRQNFSMKLILQKLEGWGYWWKLHNPNFKRFWLIHPCDRRTNRQTELRWHIRAIAYMLSRVKTVGAICEGCMWPQDNLRMVSRGWQKLTGVDLQPPAIPTLRIGVFSPVTWNAKVHPLIRSTTDVTNDFLTHSSSSFMLLSSRQACHTVRARKESIVNPRLANGNYRWMEKRSWSSNRRERTSSKCHKTALEATGARQ